MVISDDEEEVALPHPVFTHQKNAHHPHVKPCNQFIS